MKSSSRVNDLIIFSVIILFSNLTPSQQRVMLPEKKDNFHVSDGQTFKRVENDITQHRSKRENGEISNEDFTTTVELPSDSFKDLAGDSINSSPTTTELEQSSLTTASTQSETSSSESPTIAPTEPALTDVPLSSSTDTIAPTAPSNAASTATTAVPPSSLAVDETASLSAKDNLSTGTPTSTLLSGNQSLEVVPVHTENVPFYHKSDSDGSTASSIESKFSAKSPESHNTESSSSPESRNTESSSSPESHNTESSSSPEPHNTESTSSSKKRDTEVSSTTNVTTTPPSFASLHRSSFTIIVAIPLSILTGIRMFI